MKKKYLKTVEEVLALKNTDTKIYINDSETYHQFINGVLCKFIDGYWVIGSCVYLGDNPYILEEELMQEATEEDVGKLCKFWDEESETPKNEILKFIRKDCEYRYDDSKSFSWKHCRRLSPAEVSEITGYKVEEVE